MKNLTRRDLVASIFGVIILFSILLAWQLISLTNLIPETVFPPASSALLSLYQQVVTGSIAPALIATLMRLFEGYALASVIGVAIGVIMGLRRTAESTGNPLVQFLRPMPSVILMPLAILYMGLGSVMIVSLVTYACIWPILINTIDGVKSIDAMVLDTARVFKVQGLERFRKIILPATAPFIFSGLRVSLATSWIVAITAEIISTAATTGIGTSIYFALNNGNLAEMYGDIIVTAVVAYALNRLFLFVEGRILPWYAKSKGRA